MIFAFLLFLLLSAGNVGARFRPRIKRIADWETWIDHREHLLHNPGLVSNIHCNILTAGQGWAPGSRIRARNPGM